MLTYYRILFVDKRSYSRGKPKVFSGKLNYDFVNLQDFTDRGPMILSAANFFCDDL